MRFVRPTILALLLAGSVLTLVMAPSTLEAQQTPPGARPAGGYDVPRRGPSSPEIALSPLAEESADRRWWVVGLIGAVVAAGGVGVIYARRRS